MGSTAVLLDHDDGFRIGPAGVVDIFDDRLPARREVADIFHRILTGARREVSKWTWKRVGEEFPGSRGCDPLTAEPCLSQRLCKS
jgi:hypothetical protein